MVRGKAHINVDETNQDIFHVCVCYLEVKGITYCYSLQ